MVEKITSRERVATHQLFASAPYVIPKPTLTPKLMKFWAEQNHSPEPFHRELLETFEKMGVIVQERHTKKYLSYWLTFYKAQWFIQCEATEKDGEIVTRHWDRYEVDDETTGLMPPRSGLCMDHGLYYHLRREHFTNIINAQFKKLPFLTRLKLKIMYSYWRKK